MRQGNLTEPLDVANREDEIANGLNACSFMAEDLGVEDFEVKPCIARYYRDGCTRGFSIIGRNDACHLIAVELRRLGFGDMEMLPYLRDWNKKNTPPIPDTDIKRVIEKAFRKVYNYGCQNRKLIATCIKKENCPYIRNGVGTYKKTVIWRDFILKGWQWIVSPTARSIYNEVLPEMEYRRQISPGGKIYVNHRELAAIIGLKSHSRIGQYLEELHDRRLIIYVHGDPLKKNRRASEITRVVPVPDVPEIFKMGKRN